MSEQRRDWSHPLVLPLQSQPTKYPIEHIFLDMDGVITDFTTAVLRLHGKTKLMSTWPRGERDIPKVLGISRTKYWEMIDSQGAAFWHSLQPLPWFADLLALIREFGPMTILSAPSLSPASLEGKAHWLYEHFPKVKGKRFTDFLFGTQKHLLAGKDRVLIDDSDENVERFRNAGGHAILFPQVWNANHGVHDQLGFVRSQLRSICDHL